MIKTIRIMWALCVAWAAGCLVARGQADITGGGVTSGDTVCATATVNARSAAGLSSAVVASMTSGACGRIHGGILTKDGYKWYELDYNGQRVWVAGKYLSKSSSSSGGAGTCSSSQKAKACQILNNHNVQLAKVHPSGVSDQAYSYNNIRDMCNGHQAHRSSYSCSECPSGTPGGTVCLTDTLLDYLIRLLAKGRVIVNELAGACHSCASRHYNGQAVDLHNDGRTAEYLSECRALGGWAIEEGHPPNHVHCQFYD